MFIRTIHILRWLLPAVGLATLVIATSRATAGNPGDPFLLGKDNSVNATTSLDGAVSGGPQLKVSNTSTYFRGTSAIEGEAANGSALYGTSPAIGVNGQSASGTGVLGEHTGATGTTPGVFGQTNSASGQAVGVLGKVAPTSPGPASVAVRGQNNGTGGYGIGVSGTQAGSGVGVYGSAPSGQGIWGTSTSGTGVFGISLAGGGVKGVHTYSTGSAPGVEGDTSAGAGVGVLAKNTGGGPALKVVVNPGVTPFSVDSSTKVYNLNADQVDGMSASDFVPALKVLRDGPFFASPNSGHTLETVGQLKFSDYCYQSNGDQVLELDISSTANNAAYAAFRAGGSPISVPNMYANTQYELSKWEQNAGTALFIPVTGEAVAANAHEVFFNLYMAQNAQGATDGSCVFGGTFTVN
jgi:hypothetical protein